MRSYKLETPLYLLFFLFFFTHSLPDTLVAQMRSNLLLNIFHSQLFSLSLSLSHIAFYQDLSRISRTPTNEFVLFLSLIGSVMDCRRCGDAGILYHTRFKLWSWVWVCWGKSHGQGVTASNVTSTWYDRPNTLPSSSFPPSFVLQLIFCNTVLPLNLTRARTALYSLCVSCGTPTSCHLLLLTLQQLQPLHQLKNLSPA